LERRGLALASVAVITAWAGLGIAQLSYDDDYRSVFHADSEQYRGLERLTREFGREENDLVVLFESDDVMRPAGLRRLDRLHHDLEGTAGVTSVYSLVSLPRLAALLRRRDVPDARLEQAALEAGGQELVLGRLLSQDRRLALLVARLGERPRTLEELEPVLARIDRVAARYGATVTGIPALRRAAVRAIQRDQVYFSISAAVLATAMMLLIFRHALVPLLIGVGPALGVIWTLGAMGWAGEKLNILNALVPQFIAAIGFADAVHLVSHVRRRLGEGSALAAAAHSAVEELGPACWLTSLTTAVGFGSLVLARGELIRRFGLACAAGTLLCFVAVLIVVPLICSTPLGRAAAPVRSRQAGSRSSRWLECFSAPALARPGAVALAAVAALVALLVLSADLRPDYRYTENLPDTSPATGAIARREAAFGGSVPVLVRVGWSPELGLDAPAVQATLRRVRQILSDEPLVTGVTSIADFVAAAGGDPEAPQELLARLPPDLTGRFVAADGRATLVAGLLPDLGSAELQPLLERLSARLGQAGAPGVPVELGGLTALAASSSVLMIGDLARSLGSAALVIFAALMLALRSVRLGLVSLVPNLLPLCGVTALLARSGLHLQYVSVAVLTIGLGLAVDDTIHLLVAFRRSSRDRPALAAVREALRGVGAALCTTTGLLICGLVTLGWSAVPTIRLFGLLLCGLLALALVADLLALPALLLWAERWNERMSPAPAGLLAREADE
jgi:hypothetical protein